MVSMYCTRSEWWPAANFDLWGVAEKRRKKKKEKKEKRKKKEGFHTIDKVSKLYLFWMSFGDYSIHFQEH